MVRHRIVARGLFADPEDRRDDILFPSKPARKAGWFGCYGRVDLENCRLTQRSRELFKLGRNIRYRMAWNKRQG